MRARVTSAFQGVEDGKVYPREIAVGEIVSGDLAREAIAGGHADAVDEAKEVEASKRRAADEARAAEEANKVAAAKRLTDLQAIAKGANVDIAKAKTAGEIETALTAAGVTIPA